MMFDGCTLLFKYDAAAAMPGFVSGWKLSQNKGKERITAIAVIGIRVFRTEIFCIARRLAAKSMNSGGVNKMKNRSAKIDVLSDRRIESENGIMRRRGMSHTSFVRYLKRIKNIAARTVITDPTSKNPKLPGSTAPAPEIMANNAIGRDHKVIGGIQNVVWT